MSHVAFVIPRLDRIGGAERQVLDLAFGLARRRWHVSVVALSGEAEQTASALTKAGIDVLPLRMRKGVADPRGWIRFHGWLRVHRPEILHAHLPHASWMARLSRALAPVRVVIDTIHTSATIPPARRMAYHITTRQSDCVTAVSQGVFATCLSVRISRPANTCIVPNGIDTRAWAPDPAARAQVRQELGMRDDFLWCNVGRLEPVKDHALLLHALAALPPRAHLVIAGSGGLDQSLRALAQHLGLESRVRFVGFQPDPRRWLQAADGFVLTSRWEGLPICLLEAAACGLPCVSTDVSGVCEIVADGTTGFLAVPGNVDSVTAAMMRLMAAEPEERVALGARARRRIEEQFGMDSVLGEWEHLYSALLADRPEPTRSAVAHPVHRLSVKQPSGSAPPRPPSDSAA